MAERQEGHRQVRLGLHGKSRRPARGGRCPRTWLPSLLDSRHLPDARYAKPQLSSAPASTFKSIIDASPPPGPRLRTSVSSTSLTLHSAIGRVLGRALRGGPAVGEGLLWIDIRFKFNRMFSARFCFLAKTFPKPTF